MDKALGMQNSTLENVVLLASRLLLAWIFLHEGIFQPRTLLLRLLAWPKPAFLRLLSLPLSAYNLSPVSQLRWGGMHVSVRPHWACFV